LRYTLLILTGLALLLLTGCTTIGQKEAEDPLQENMTSEQITESLTRGNTALHKGDLEAAMVDYIKVATQDPRNVDALFGIATVHTINQDMERAEAIYRTVLTIDAEHGNSLENLGLITLQQGRSEEAEAFFRRAIAVDETRWSSQNGLGIIDDLHGDYTKAQQHYRNALRSNPNAKNVLNNIGYSKYLSGDLNGAKSYYRQVLTVDSDNRTAWSNLALVQIRQRDYKAAVHSLEKVMNPYEALNNTGYLAYLDGDSKNAEMLIREAIRQSPSYYEEAYSNLALIRLDEEQVFAQ